MFTKTSLHISGLVLAMMMINFAELAESASSTTVPTTAPTAAPTTECKRQADSSSQLFEQLECSFKCYLHQETIMKDDFGEIDVYSGTYCSTKPPSACINCNNPKTMVMNTRYNLVTLGALKEPTARVCFVDEHNKDEPIKDKDRCEKCVVRKNQTPFVFLCADLDKQKFDANKSMLVFETWGPLADDRYEYIGSIKTFSHNILKDREVFRTLEVQTAASVADYKLILTWSNGAIDYRLSTVVLLLVLVAGRLVN